MRKFIRAVVPLFLAAFLPAFTGCTDMVQDDLDATQKKLRDLQEYVAGINDQLTTLDKIVGALDDSHSITSVSAETEEGYTITFKDGSSVFIKFGQDGKDGRTLIPVGVRYDEDGHYYWTVDGEWFLIDGAMVRADASDGADGFAPQVKVEDGYWWISFDGGESFTQIASCEMMDGVGVFADHPDMSDPSKFVLVLWDGTRVEIPYYIPLKLSFDESVPDIQPIAAGESLEIPYKVLVEGDITEPLVVTAGTDGTYIPVLADPGSLEGVVRITAPEPFVEGYIFLTATSGGYSTVKMISFEERKIPVESITVRLGASDEGRSVPYETNFEYEVLSIDYPESENEEDKDWLEVVPDFETGTILFKPKENAGERIRTCTVVISPKDNPDFVISTFDVRQATESAITFDEFRNDSGFKFNPEEKTLEVPAEGGDADIWMTSRPELPLSVTIPSEVEWVTADISSADGFWKLHIHADALDPGDPRNTVATIKVTAYGIPFEYGKIEIIQK